jgi:CBS domain-containing protein
VAGPLIYVSKLVRLPLVDAEAATIGRLADVVLAPPLRDVPPRVIGFVASVERRKIFVAAARVGEVTPFGVRLHSGTIDVGHFSLRPGELLTVEGLLHGRTRIGGDVLTDLGIQPVAGRTRAWEVATAALRSAGGLGRRRPMRVVGWQEVASVFDVGPVGEEIAGLHDLHPSDLAQRVRSLPLDRRRRLAEALDDERLADLLEELPEDEQLRIVEGLDPERVADVLEEMDPDDAADLLGEMTDEQAAALLEEMDPEEAEDIRRLMLYDEHTAGGLMTSEPIVLPPGATVAEALARLRERELPIALAAQVFVAQPPAQTPTGKFVGAVGFQRLLREPPGMAVGRCVDGEPESLSPGTPELEVAARLAAYDLVAMAVCDDDGRLVGAVTVDDVLDHALPADWRTRR